MKKKNCANILLILGVSSVATGLISAVPVHAEILRPGTIGWGSTSDNFLDEIGGELDIQVDPGTVSFATGAFAALGLAAGSATPASPSPNPINFGSPTEGTGVTGDPYIYVLPQQVSFPFDVDGPDDLEFVVPAGSNFEAISNGSGELELCSTCLARPYWRYQGDITENGNGINISSTLQFGVSGGGQSLTQGTSETVPEPMTILGTVTALGFCRVLKRQQTKKKADLAVK